MNWLCHWCSFWGQEKQFWLLKKVEECLNFSFVQWPNIYVGFGNIQRTFSLPSPRWVPFFVEVVLKHDSISKHLWNFFFLWEIFRVVLVLQQCAPIILFFSSDEATRKKTFKSENLGTCVSLSSIQISRKKNPSSLWSYVFYPGSPSALLAYIDIILSYGLLI